MVFHVLNRGVGRRKVFYKDRDYAAFERVLKAMLELAPMRLLAYCLMPGRNAPARYRTWRAATASAGGRGSPCWRRRRSERETWDASPFLRLFFGPSWPAERQGIFLKRV